MAARWSNLKAFKKLVQKGSYTCNQCEYISGYRHSLKTHMQAKHDGLKLKCSVCAHEANSNVSLRMHYRSRHGGIKL